MRSSLNINSQSEVTWLTWAALEEEQGDPVRAEEIRDLYFQQVSTGKLWTDLFCCPVFHEQQHSSRLGAVGEPSL